MIVLESLGFALLFMLLAVALYGGAALMLDAQRREHERRLREWQEKHPIKAPKYYIGRLK